MTSLAHSGGRPLCVAWISDFPLEWLPDLPGEVGSLPKSHPLTWQRVLLSEFEKEPSLHLHIIALRKNIARSLAFERKGVTFHVIKVPPQLRAPTFFWIDTILIKRVLKKIRPDIVHAWGTEKGAALVASRFGYPYLVTIQGLLSWYREMIPLHGYWHVARLLEELSLPRAPLVTTESTPAVDFLKRKFPRLPVWQAEHAPDWIFHHNPRKPQTKPARFIFVGTVGYRKGGDLLISALDQLGSRLPFELMIIGEPEAGFLQKAQAIASRETWNRIELQRSLSPEQVAAELSRATMLLFPTRADTSPNAVKEAVVAGVPVVASGVGGINDYLLHGRNGLIFPSGNLSAFVDVIAQACGHPLFGAGLVETSTLTSVRAYLSPAAMRSRFLAAYHVLAGKANGGRIECSMMPPLICASHSEAVIPAQG